MWYALSFHTKKHHQTKGRYVQDYTLSEAFAPAQTFDIPAFGGKLDVSWNPESQVTQWGGLAYFVSYLKTSGLFDRLVEDAPFHYTSPNAPEVRDVVGTAVLSIICGFTRYVHINRLRNDTVLATLLGLGRIVCEDSVRRALKNADGQELENKGTCLSRVERRRLCLKIVMCVLVVAQP